MVGCKLIEKERNASENHCEQIVELVGNAAREMPDRLHLLCLRELGLGVREIVVGALQVPIEAGIVQGDRSLRSERLRDRKSTRLNSSHLGISYAVFCLKKNKIHTLSRKRLHHD